jgi:hypothetical protein
VSVDSNTAPAIHQVQVMSRESTFSISSRTEPTSIVLDPDVWPLAQFGAFQKAVTQE